MLKNLSLKKLKIAQQLLYTSIVIMVTVSLLIIGYITVSSLNSTNNQYAIQAKANATSVIEKIDRNFYERFGDVQAFAFNRLAVRTAYTDSVKQDAQDFINTMVSYYVLYDLMIITDIKGNVVAANTLDKTGKPVNSSSIIGTNFANEEWFRTCISGSGPEGGAWFSDFIVNKQSAALNGNNGWGMAFAAQIKTPDGEVVGTWYNFANWGEVTQGIRRETQAALNEVLPGTFMLVSNNSDEIIDADDESLIINKTPISEADFNNGSTFKYKGQVISNEDYIVGKTTGHGAYIYKGKDWNSLTFIPKAKFNFGYFVDNLLILFIAVILITIFVCYIFYLLARSISSNINRLKEDIDVLASGNLVEIQEVNTEDEIGQMSVALKGLVGGLKEKSEFAEKIGSGQLQVNYDALSNEDILGHSLLNMRENLVKVAEDDKKRNWATEGIAKFGDILRANNEGIEVLSENIISNLVKYLNANQGALFVVNDVDRNDVFLEMAACYAWNKKKYLHMRVDKGEGLVGQAWQESDTIYITDVPEDFVNITSGLGGATPNSFLIVPLKVNDETYGIIEIASFQLFEQFHIEFVNKLAESIASTLSTAKTNERTKILLEQSQQQTEEMRAQEEEMRQNMEEMQATQEEMERKEAEMSRMVEQMQQQEEEMRQNMEEMVATQEEMDKQNGIIIEKTAETKGILDGINISFATIEFTPDGHIVTANDNFLTTMKCELSDIYGKHHSIFVKEEDKNSDEYKHFWKDLASGKYNTGRFERINFAGESVWINATYTPIFNSDGDVIKVMKYASNITDLMIK
jgi:PAS domain S-box-containing protein